MKPSSAPRRRDGALLWIAVFKLLKATLLIALGAGALTLVHDADTASALRGLAREVRVDPENRLIHRVIAAVSRLDPKKLEELGLGTFVYAAVFLVEGGGLVMRRRWAEYLTTIVTGSFVPLEAYELVEHPSPLKAGGILLNLLIVGYLAHRLWRERRAS